MFESFYAMYASQEREAWVLIRKILGGGFHADGNFWSMTAISWGMVFCDSGEFIAKEGRIEWPIQDEERNSDKGWGRFHENQIVRLKLRPLLPSFVPSHCTSEIFNAWMIVDVVEENAQCSILEEVLAEKNKPIVIDDDVLGCLELNRDFSSLEGAIFWCGREVSLSLEVDPEKKGSWTRAQNSAKKMLASAELWDQQMRAYAAKKLTSLANRWQKEDENTKDDPPLTEEIFARRLHAVRIAMTSGGSFTVYYDDDDMFWGHVVVVSGTLKSGVKYAAMEG